MGKSSGHLAVFYEACFTQGILVLLYLYTIIRMLLTKRLNFVMGIAMLLLISCVTWPIECWYQAAFIE